MPCFYPRQAFYSRSFTKTGKRAVTFDPRQSFDLSSHRFIVPCQKCKHCRLMNARQWAMRCMHEASLHNRNSFITLTYNNANLPSNGSLDVEVFKLFMKRLRKRFAGDKMLRIYPSFFKKSGIRFYHCGEYGEKFRRPHYHAILFGCDFPDKYEFIPKGRKPVNGIRYYRSPILEDLWPFGYSVIGDVTFESASYVARYCMKKIDGKLKEAGYYIPNGDLKPFDNFDVSTGEIFELKPEYATMSRRSAIAKEWYALYKGDVYPHDYTYLRNREMRPPKYYDRLYEFEFPEEFAIVKAKRKRVALERELREFPTGDLFAKAKRLDDLERFTDINSSKLIRSLDAEL